MYQVKINGDLCIGCRLCAIKCDAFDLRSDVLSYIVDESKLDETCLEAEKSCPEGAIKVTQV